MYSGTIIGAYRQLSLVGLYFTRVIRLLLPFVDCIKMLVDIRWRDESMFLPEEEQRERIKSRGLSAIVDISTE